MNGIEKEIDGLGRVVIPSKIRSKLGIEAKSKVLVSLENDSIVISVASKRCLLCGEKTENEQKIQLCHNCILRIKEEF